MFRLPAESTNEEDQVVDGDVETKVASQNCEASEAECTKNLVKKFVNGLSELLSDLCKCSDVLFADDIILNFASRFCAGNYNSSYHNSSYFVIRLP